MVLGEIGAKAIPVIELAVVAVVVLLEEEAKMVAAVELLLMPMRC